MILLFMKESQISAAVFIILDIVCSERFCMQVFSSFDRGSRATRPQPNFLISPLNLLLYFVSFRIPVEISLSCITCVIYRALDILPIFLQFCFFKLGLQYFTGSFIVILLISLFIIHSWALLNFKFKVQGGHYN